MSQPQGPLYNLLKWVAICGGVMWLGYEFYRHFAGMGPGDVAFVDGNNVFKDGHYERSAEYYNTALEENPQHHGAMIALANSYVQIKKYDLALNAIERAIKFDPDFGGAFAIRGIIYDHMGRYEQAMADYDKSLKMDPVVSKGMHWLDRLLYNVQDAPPTVADRLAYLQQQMALPQSQRVLRNPKEDEKQRPYQR